MFERRSRRMLKNPASRWCTMPGLKAAQEGHPAPGYISRRTRETGPGPWYGEGFGGPIGGDRHLSRFEGRVSIECSSGQLTLTDDQPVDCQPPQHEPRGIVDRYEGPETGHQRHGKR